MNKTVPIMSKDDERFMAFCGLVQWTRGVIHQSKRIVDTTNMFHDLVHNCDLDHVALMDTLRCEHLYFVVAVNKLLEHRRWVQDLGLCKEIDFAEIDSFPGRDIKDLRNMREHIVEYFQGNGRNKSRWHVETPEYKADASSCVGTKIGGRLDYAKFTEAATRLLGVLIHLPVPYPPRDIDS
ncbi:hypothetical protein [Pulveribacter sp.]|uniref:hypothetical protein n=1 Tax=Pulveribacter sp. TaxID=2678893 RepID=UPI0028B13C68|nr:hypothetical protein [Pulveribacter sp.]